MRKLKRIPLLVLLAGLVMVLAGTGCSSSDDEPDGGGKDNGQTVRQPARINIQDASALILYSGEGERSRAIDGEFGRPGLYKLDANGNVSMVAIYCSTDADGNKIETEHSLTVAPLQIKSLSENYIALYGCSYYDEDGDQAATVAVSNLLIHKPTGDIYSLDDLVNSGVINPYSYTGFYEEPSGSLLVYEELEGKVGRLTVSGRKASYAQLNNGKGFYGDSRPGGIHVTPAGQIISSYLGLAADMAVLYPNGGYDYLGENDVPAIPGVKTIHTLKYKLDYINFNGFIWLDGAPYHLRQEVYETESSDHKSFMENFFGLMKVSVGSQSGQATFSEKSTLHLVDECVFSPFVACAVGDNLLVDLINNSEGNNVHTYVVYNSTGDKWINMGSPIKFLSSNTYLQPDAVYGGRAWIVDLPDGAKAGKIWWIDPAAQQTGSVDLKLTGVDVERYDVDYQTGRIVVRGVRRSDSHNCIITFDLATGKSETVFSSPDLLNIDLLLLSE